MFRKFIKSSVGALALCAGLSWGQELPPAEQVFKPQLSNVNGDVILKIDFPAEHYLYANKTTVNGGQNYESSPAPVAKEDPYLGPVQTWEQPPTLKLRDKADSYELVTQGCKKDVVCYPPTRWVLEAPAAEPATAEPKPADAEPTPAVADATPTNVEPQAANAEPTPAVAEPQAATADATPTNAEPTPAVAEPTAAMNRASPNPNRGLFNQSKTLSDEEAFVSDFAYEQNGDLSVAITMPAGFYLYKSKIRGPGELALPPGEMHRDEFFGEQEIYRHKLSFTVPRAQLSGNEFTLQLQGCEEGKICYPPFTRSFPLNNKQGGALGVGKDKPATAVTTNPSAESDHRATEAVQPDTGSAADAPATASPGTGSSGSLADGITQRLQTNFFAALFWVWLMGLGASFTACVYPLVPIVSSMVVGQNVSSRRAYALVSTYVLGMALALALLGAVFAYSEVNLQLVLQKPWISALVALLFIGLALSLFDVFVIQGPAFLNRGVDKLSRQQKSGSFGGALAMGALSILVVSPCATPILAALLIFVTQTTVAKGALALFVFGLGMGFPLLVFASALKKYMPKAGGWMNRVKSLFAFALLAVGLWLLTRIAPLLAGQLLWTGYALFACVYWLPNKLENRGDRLRLFISLLAFILALALGSKLFSDGEIYEQGSGSSPYGSGASLSYRQGSASTVGKNAAQFITINTKGELERDLGQSSKTVLVDFYADWCVACQRWEREIWRNPRFAADLGRFTLLKLDVTDFNDQHRAIFKSLKLVGPPAVLAYGPRAPLAAPRETIIGELAADDFAAKLKGWQSSL